MMQSRRLVSFAAKGIKLSNNVVSGNVSRVTMNMNRFVAARSFSDGTVPTDPTPAVDTSSIIDSAKMLIDDNALDAAVAVVAAEQHSNFVVQGVMSMIENIHVYANVPYWEAIVLSTIVLRVCILPIGIKTVQGSSRMALMRPAMQKVQDAMNKDPNMNDMNVKMRYQKEMQALFLKYKVNPLRAVLWPLFQFPIFISFFLALQSMGTFYPGFVDGGAFWFQNLGASDPYYIFPAFNAISFLAMIELGGDGVQMQQQQTFKNVMRGIAVLMVPLTATMPMVNFLSFSSFFVFYFIFSFLISIICLFIGFVCVLDSK